MNIVRSVVLASVVICCLSYRALAGWVGDSDGGREFTNSFGGFIGYNMLQKGFTGYTNYASFGADWYMISDDSLYSVNAEDQWKDNIFYRVSFDYFPLVVPEGNYGASEDMVALSGDALYSIYHNEKVRCFAGMGIGAYLDRISVDTPATGKLSSQYFYPGLKSSVGAIFRVYEDYEVIPEIRTHWIYTVNNYFTVNTVVQVGFARRFK